MRIFRLNRKAGVLPALLVLSAAVVMSVAAGGGREEGPAARPADARAAAADGPEEGLELATLGGGCFWCLEAVFERMDGVKSVVSGYAGGTRENPTYEEVTTGRTGHAEVVQVAYDPEVIGYEDLLERFWKAHDPTTLNRQGADVGTQYRSIILTHGEEQRLAAERSLAEAGGGFERPIVTEIRPLEVFYPAEDYHQDYYEKNPNAGYCQVVIRPKLEKMGLDFRPRQ